MSAARPRHAQPCTWCEAEGGPTQLRAWWEVIALLLIWSTSIGIMSAVCWLLVGWLS